MIEKALAAACAALLILCTVFYVRMNWAITDLAQYRADVAINTQKAEAEARKKEQAMQRQNERITNEQANKDAERKSRAAGVDAATHGMRDEIDRLNASAASAGADSAAIAGQARTARELLGACTEEYRSVAQVADELRDQVSGLQDYATSVCKAP